LNMSALGLPSSGINLVVVDEKENTRMRKFGPRESSH